MAIIPLTPQEIFPTGVPTVYTAGLTTTDTYTVPCDDRVFMHFKKSGAGSCNFIVTIPRSIEGLLITGLSSGIAASGGEIMIGPHRKDVFGDPLTGLLSFTLTEITGLSVGVFRLR